MSMLKNALILVFLVSFLSPVPAFEIDQAARSKNKAVSENVFRENQGKFKDNPDMLVLPGLLADRKAGRLTLQAEATGVGEGDPVEFFIVGEASGHAYESVTVCYARPGDIQRGLEFIGMEAGRPADGKKCLFWPKGERVIMTFSSMDPAATIPPTRLENLVMDSRAKKALPLCGLVFTGSVMLDSTNTPGMKALAVDVREPNSIASTYNAYETVLDVPFAWSQKYAYGNVLVNPSHLLRGGCPLTIVLEPEYRNGKKRVLDLKLDVTVKPDSGGKTLDDLEFHVRDAAHAELNTNATLTSMLKLFDSLNESGRDPFVTLGLPDGITIGAAARFCSLIAEIDSDKGIRMEAPPANHLYYRAFTPNEQQRNRAERFSQPWELSLSLTSSTVSGVLSKVEQSWKNDKVEPDLKVTDFPVSSPKDLQKELKEKGPGIPVIFVFADPLVTYGQLMDFIRPVFKSYPMIHVYVKRG